MKIRDVMSRNLQNISPQATLAHAAKMMRALNVGALPVCDNDKPIGILTDRDITVRAVAGGKDPSRACACEVMTDNVIHCYEDEDVSEAARIMEAKQIRRLLVFDRNDRVVGIVSLGDIATRVHSDQLSGQVLERVSEPSHAGGAPQQYA